MTSVPHNLIMGTEHHRAIHYFSRNNKHAGEMLFIRNGEKKLTQFRGLFLRFCVKNNLILGL